MDLTPEELAALPERLRDALASGPVTLEESIAEWEPEGQEYFADLEGDPWSTQSYSRDALARWRAQGLTRATKQQAERLATDRRAYCRQHAYRDQYAPEYVEPPFGSRVYTVGFDEIGVPLVFESDWRNLNEITMPEWLCEQLVGDIKSGRYKL